MNSHAVISANSPCCICGSEVSKELFARRYEKFNYSGEFHMRKCTGCELLFCSPRLTDDGIAALYDANYYVFQKPDADYFARTAAIYQRTVALLPSGLIGRVAEIGSGKGYLLAALKGLGWEPYGIEISRDAKSYAERVFGLQGFAGTIEEFCAAEGSGQKFPVVLCIDIIEHVTDPACFVSNLSRITEAGGYLVIDTPNGAAAHIQSEHSKWRGFNPFHIFVFNEANLGKLLNRYGFHIEQAFTYNNTHARRDAAEAPRTLFDRLLSVFRTVPDMPPPTDLPTCVEACRKLPGYFSTADAKSELASGLHGENLVLVARRSR